MTNYSERDYGLPSAGTPIGTPRATPAPAGVPACPNCGCSSIHLIEVDCENSLLRGGRGVLTYFGCPACPWASPAMARATPSA